MTARDRLVPWIVGAIVLTVSLSAVYFTAQQLDRRGADEQPQRLASQLASVDLGAEAATERVDLGSSDAIFYIVYDQDGEPLRGTGYLDGELARVPSGVIAAAATDGTNSVTWEPRDGLRFATVEVLAGSQVILAGQSLEPSETRTHDIALVLLAAWVLGLAVLTVGAGLHRRISRTVDR
jgi:hypothetical protein